MKLEIQSSTDVLRNRGVILYPTDTVWGLGCDATSATAVSKIFNLKQRHESKSLIILVDSFEMLQRYVVRIPKAVKVFLEHVSKPTTVIYKNPLGLANTVIARDNTVAIRIANNMFCKELIHRFGKPIVSTSANISNKPTPKSFKEIDSLLLDAVDYVVNLQQDKLTYAPSTIIKIDENGQPVVLRK